jgi:hypothetical protein
VALRVRAEPKMKRAITPNDRFHLRGFSWHNVLAA